jgi:hypothetical protein
LSIIPGLSNLKPVKGKEVAQAMINASFRHIVGIHSYTMGEVIKLATRNQLSALSIPQSLL